MELDNAAEILLIIVSSVLVIFLIAFIVLIIKIIKVMRSLNRIAEKAEHIADKAESFSTFITKTSGPAVAVRSVLGMVNNLLHNDDEVKTSKSRRKGR